MVTVDFAGKFFELKGDFVATKDAVKSSKYFRYDPAGRFWVATSQSWDVVDFLKPFLSEEDKKDVENRYRKLIVENVRERVRKGEKKIGSRILAAASILYPVAETRDFAGLCKTIKKNEPRLIEITCKMVTHHGCTFENAIRQAKDALAEAK